MLSEIDLSISPCPIPDSVSAFIDEALQWAKDIDCFDFVPSNYQVVYRVLQAIQPGRFCEWGSGMGVVTGLAEMLGFTAYGIEIDGQLAVTSRKLLQDFGLMAPIETGDYFESTYSADVYFTYCWPGKILRAEEHFLSIAPDHARLLICHGAEDVRCKVKS